MNIPSNCPFCENNFVEMPWVKFCHSCAVQATYEYSYGIYLNSTSEPEKIIIGVENLNLIIYLNINKMSITDRSTWHLFATFPILPMDISSKDDILSKFKLFATFI